VLGPAAVAVLRPVRGVDDLRDDRARRRHHRYGAAGRRAVPDGLPVDPHGPDPGHPGLTGLTRPSTQISPPSSQESPSPCPHHSGSSWSAPATWVPTTPASSPRAPGLSWRWSSTSTPTAPTRSPARWGPRDR